MSKLKIYQAGPIQNSENFGYEWRKRFFTDYPDIEWLNPFYVNKIEDESLCAEDEYNTVSDAQIVEGDKHMILNSDAVFVRYEDCRSTGTAQEVAFAYENNIPVLTHNMVEDPSCWMKYHSDFFHSYESTIISAIDMVIKKKPLHRRLWHKIKALKYDSSNLDYGARP